MLTRIELSGTQRYTYTQQWDVDNRLIAVTNTATLTVTRFYYDGNGQRVKRVESKGGTTITTAYAGAIEVTISGTQRITQAYYLAGAQRVATRVITSTGSVVYYIHADHLGSASLTTDASGNKVGELRYMPYGETRYVWGSTPTDRRYTGQRSEEASLGSLYDYGARFYSPSLNRFISPDTIVPSPGNPQSLNRYSYVLGNPLIFADPTGHYECEGMDCGHPPHTANPNANPFGIRFTADAGLSWDAHNANEAMNAAGTIAHRLTSALHRASRAAHNIEGVPFRRLSPAAVFRQVFGSVTFNLNGGNCDGHGCWARADKPRGTIQVYIRNVAQGIYTALNAVHELGHTSDWRTGFQARSDLEAEWNANPNFPRRDSDNKQPRGYAGLRWTWQQSGEATPSEEFADMFLGWTYNRWESSAAGTIRSQWMTTNMADWIALVTGGAR